MFMQRIFLSLEPYLEGHLLDEIDSFIVQDLMELEEGCNFFLCFPQGKNKLHLIKTK